MNVILLLLLLLQSLFCCSSCVFLNYFTSKCHDAGVTKSMHSSRFMLMNIATTASDNLQQQQQQLRYYIPIVNTTSMNITPTNPFGLTVFNINDAVTQLLAVANHEDNVIWDESKVKHYRIEYLTKYLESKYIPIQTSQFMSFALSGTWDLKYTNLLTPASVSKDIFRYTSIYQSIQFNDECTGGTLKNVVAWESCDGSGKHTGDLTVINDFIINSKGALVLSLNEHIITPESTAPDDLELLVQTMQKSIPFDMFDPDNSMLSLMYLDPHVRVCKCSGERHSDVVNVFSRRIEANKHAIISKKSGVV